MQSTAQMVFWLVIVLLMIPACLHLLKRSGWAARASGHAAPAQVMHVVAQTNLGPGQRVVTLEVNAGGERTWLVLGVTGQAINTLSQMPAPVAANHLAAAATQPFASSQASARVSNALTPAFAALLQRFQATPPPSTTEKVV